MRKYQAADGSAADELVSLVNPILSRFFHGMAGDVQRIEDVLQDCWLRIHRARSSYRPGEPVLPWIFAIARHTRVDSFRRWQRTAGRECYLDDSLEQSGANPAIQLNNSLQAQSILATLKKLPEGQREVLLMMKVSDMSVEEVALATGSTIPAVKQKAYRAYRSVRRVLGLSSSAHSAD